MCVWTNIFKTYLIVREKGYNHVSEWRGMDYDVMWVWTNIFKTYLIVRKKGNILSTNTLQLDGRWRTCKSCGLLFKRGRLNDKVYVRSQVHGL